MTYDEDNFYYLHTILLFLQGEEFIFPSGRSPDLAAALAVADVDGVAAAAGGAESAAGAQHALSV